VVAAEVRAGARAVGSLFDRESELEQIETVLEAGVRGIGGFAYVEGHPGIGKTRLLDVAQARGRALGLRVLSGSGSELERDFGYGVVRQLFEAAVIEAPPAVRRELLRGPARRAALAIGADPEPRVAAADSPFPVIHALYRLTANLASSRPLVLVLDDAHWADVASLRFLDYVVGRLERLPLCVVLAARPAEPDAPHQLLARLRDWRAPRLVRPRLLGVEGITGVLREAYEAEPDESFAAACLEASAGNPFLLHALVDALRLDGVEPITASSAAVRDLGPDTVGRSLLLRLAALPPEASQVLDAVAIFGGESELRHVAGTAGLAHETVADVADLLAEANVLDMDRPLRFVHPVVREAVYGELRPAARARLHRRAAAALLAEGQPAGQVAPHLLMTEPAGDDQVVSVLRAAAGTAVAQGVTDLARTYLRRALDEPPSGDARADVLAELGLAEAAGADELGQAAEHLERSAAQTRDPACRARRVEATARVKLYRGDLQGAVDLLERVRGGADADTELRLTAHQAAIGLLQPPLARAAVARLEDFTDVGGATPGEVAALAELGASRWLDGRIEAAATFAQRALADDLLLDAEGLSSVSFNHALRVLVDADRYDRADEAIEAGMEHARERGSMLGAANLAGVRVVAAWRRGRVAETEAGARAVLEMLERSSTPVVGPAHYGYLALALTARGDLDGAEAAVERSGVGPSLPRLTYLGVPFLARARLRLAQQRPDDALADLRELCSRDERLGVRHLSVPWHRTAAEAALAVGDTSLAASFADDQLERARRWCTPSGRGLALSTKGLVTGGEEGLELLEAGATLLVGSPARLDYARSLVDLGIALRRAGRRAKARAPLRDGLDAARGCGATLLADLAHAELIAAGAKPRRLQFSGVESLTASEHRVAYLAADGLSNREIGATLYVTVRTVENHLARTYRKLGIGSRKELQSALG
jgi:DNA-binding CsgD family transcriptional regulator